MRGREKCLKGGKSKEGVRGKSMSSQIDALSILMAFTDGCVKM